MARIASAPDGMPPSDRSADVRLARLHLRTGAFALARAELESLAGSGDLDEDALLDLAEVRWRTDDVTGAGEAAAAFLATGRLSVVALVIAAESTAALGRPAEARRLAGQALELANGPLEFAFAGIPRSGVWPSEPVERADPFEPMIVPGWARSSATRRSTPWSSASGAPGGAGRASGADHGSGDSETLPPGLEAADAIPDPGLELEAAKAELAAGEHEAAAIRLAVVLRFLPALAPVVLDIAATEPGPSFDLIRGDALRLVGREGQARRAYAAAAGRVALDPVEDAVSANGPDDLVAGVQ